MLGTSQSISRGSYDAILYPSGSNMVARNSQGDIIATGTNHNTVRDAALTYIYDHDVDIGQPSYPDYSAGVLQLGSGIFNWSTSPTIASNLTIRGNGRSSYIKNTADVTPFEVNSCHNVNVSDLTLCVYNPQTKPIIRLYPQTLHCFHNAFRNIRIENWTSSNRGWNAIELFSDVYGGGSILTAKGGIYFNLFENIQTNRFGLNDFIHIEAVGTGDPSFVPWINGNNFIHCTSDGPTRMGNWVITSYGAAAGNTFYSCFMNGVAETLYGFYNIPSRQTFINCTQWDFSGDYYHFADTANHCTVIHNTALMSDIVDPLKHNNLLLVPSYGSSTGTGAQQTIAHGLGVVPRKVSFTPTVSGATVSDGWYATSANIYVTVTSGKAFNWYAEP